MATQITTLTAGYILIQAGHGIPNHAAPKGSQFTDVDTATLYFNKNGLSDWEVNIDVSNSGSTIGINTFSSFSSSTVGQGSVIATTSNDNLTFSGVNLSILVDNTNQILTLSAATPSDYSFTGGTVNGFTNFTNGLSATTISATTFYGDGSNLTGLSTQDTYLTGGTYSNGTATFTNNTGGTFTVTGFKTSEVFVTGGTYSNSTGVTTFTNNTGGTFTVSGYFKPTDDVYTTGMTFNSSNYNLSITRNDGTSFTQNLAILASDMTITGGTYSSSTGIATFTNNTGGTFSVSGFLTGMTDTYTTGFTYSNNTLTLKRNASQPDLSVMINSMTGLTVNGTISTTTISATTYQNLPTSTDITVTGGTYSNGTTTFTNNTGGTFTVTGFKTSDLVVTGGTYNSGSILFTNNTGGTFSVSGLYTGYTAPVDVTVTGGTYDTNSGIATFTNNTGGTFTLTGFKTSDLVVTGGTYSNGNATFTNNTGGTFTVSGFKTSDLVVTGGTYSNGSILFTNNTGGTFNVTGLYTGYTAPIDITVTGGTYSNGNATFTNNTGGTFTVSGFKTSDLVVTGGTYNNGSILFTNNTGGTFNVTGLYTGYTAPIDVYTTGATYSDNTFTHTNNTGGTYSVLFNTVTGLTVNGNLNVTGLTTTNGITSTSGIIFKQVTINSSYTATTNDYMIDVSGGTFTITLPSAVGIQGRLLVIKNNGGGAVTVQPILGQNIDGKPFVILGETNSLQLASNGSNWVALGYNISTVNSSTGVFEFTGLTKLTSSTFSVAPVKGWIVDDTTNPLSPQLLYVAYTGGTHTATYVNTATETWVYLTSGGTISQSNIALTDKQRRQNIFLGKLGHADKTNIINAFSQPDFVLSPLSQLRDMFGPINLINEGIRPSANGSNLSINTSAGYLHGLGINFANDTLNPNAIYVSGTSPCTFQYRTQTGGTASNVTVIDPTKYDVGGVITSLSGTKATNQRIYLVQNGVFRVQYGQTEYSNLTQAIAGISSESFIEFSNFENNAILVGILSVLSSATDLTDTSKAQFFNVSKFGDSSGAAGGASTTTLQQAYNNSVNPEITTNSTLDALSIKNGTGNADNTTKLIEGLNTAGNTTSLIRADGYISGTTFQSNGFIANTNGLTATTVSATTYYNLPTDIRVTGGTYSSGTATFTNNTGGTFTVTGFSTGGGSTFTGGTVTGPTNFTNGLTATTISATTYFNLPTDVRVTGGTYTNGTATFTNNTGGTFTVTGFSTGSSTTFTGGTVTGATNFTGGLVANTISATTYQNLPTDIRVTGGTYSSGTATFTNNTGGTFTVTGFSTGGSATFNGGTVTGATYFTGGVSANTLTASGTGQNILTVIGSGNSTTSPIFSVVGSQGELFSVSDSLTGSLFSVNDISGLPIVEVFSDNTVLMGSYQAPSLNTTKKLSLTAGTNTVYSIPTSGYTGAFIDYTVISSGSTGARAGTIMSIWSGTTAQYTDVSTNDIGTTAGITFSVSVVGSNAVLSSSATTTGWTLKTIIRSI
jgi:hypothetical protein